MKNDQKPSSKIFICFSLIFMIISQRNPLLLVQLIVPSIFTSNFICIKFIKQKIEKGDMLGQSKSMTMLKGKESSMRHKVRNLRAKVRTLVPNNLCVKFQKRNQDIEKIQLNKKMYQTLHSKKDWNSSLNPSKTDHYFYDNKQKTIHLFSKLKPHEIEQINEDKNYYLGADEHIQVYDQYIYENYPNESVGLAGLGLRVSEDRKTHKTPLKTASAKLISTQLPPPSTKYMKEVKVSKFFSNHVSVTLEKRKFLEDGLNAQSSLKKMKLKQKFQNAEAVYREGRYRMYSHKKARKQEYICRCEEAKKRRNNRQQKGEIQAITSELREMLLNRQSKEGKIGK